MANVCTIQYINEWIDRDAAGLIAMSEQLYREKITQLGNRIIASADQKPLLLLAGPSGSGKTTTALRLEHYLDTHGHETHTVSMDNYFLPEHEGLPVLPNGKPDYETPKRLDIDLFSEHLKRMAACEPVEIPRFDFTDNSRHPGKVLARKPGEIVIFEGIHALNPMVTGSAQQYANRLYISVRTHIQAEENMRMHPSKIRLARRLLRDKRTRGRSPQMILEQFASVSAGERKYVHPFKNEADFEIDTLFFYELSVYRDLLLPDLRRLADAGSEHCAELVCFLEKLKPLSAELVPKDAMIREFIGGGDFEY